MTRRAPQNLPSEDLSPPPQVVVKAANAKTTTSITIKAMNISIEGDSETIQEGLQAIRDLFSALGSIPQD